LLCAYFQCYKKYHLQDFQLLAVFLQFALPNIETNWYFYFFLHFFYFFIFRMNSTSDDEEEFTNMSEFLMKLNLPAKPMWQNLYCSKVCKMCKKFAIA
jgi:hypothetical protein